VIPVASRGRTDLLLGAGLGHVRTDRADVKWFQKVRTSRSDRRPRGRLTRGYSGRAADFATSIHRFSNCPPTSAGHHVGRKAGAVAAAARNQGYDAARGGCPRLSHIPRWASDAFREVLVPRARRRGTRGDEAICQNVRIRGGLPRLTSGERHASKSGPEGRCAPDNAGNNALGKDVQVTAHWHAMSPAVSPPILAATVSPVSRRLRCCKRCRSCRAWPQKGDHVGPRQTVLRDDRTCEQACDGPLVFEGRGQTR
jgi:hypothetical protein